ncbi:MAG: single-stranded DNA-binding protein [Acidimicrobiia bacterium]|nr:single-stranded DNA-binding protein [Acidimicrobiia bacterium]
MDLNLVVLSGRLAAPPEIRTFDSGARVVRYLVTCRTDEPRRRVDVLPVTLWDPPPELASDDAVPGTPLWVAGTAQRRFWSEATGRRSRLEIVADEVAFRTQEEQTMGH